MEVTVEGIVFAALALLLLIGLAIVIRPSRPWARFVQYYLAWLVWVQVVVVTLPLGFWLFTLSIDDLFRVVVAWLMALAIALIASATHYGIRVGMGSISSTSYYGVGARVSKALKGEDDETLRAYSEAEKEVERGEQDPKLWALALVKAGGDEQKRKIEYMRIRARVAKSSLHNAKE